MRYRLKRERIQFFFNYFPKKNFIEKFEKLRLSKFSLNYFNHFNLQLIRHNSDSTFNIVLLPRNLLIYKIKKISQNQ